MSNAHDEDVLHDYKWAGAKYYDYPDGQDLGGKLSYALKLSTAGGIAIGLILAHSKCPPLYRTRDKLFVIAKGGIASVSTAVTFTVVTYALTNLRKKDDFVNHAAGGLLSGAVLGAATGSSFVSAWFALTGAAFGAAAKVHRQRGDHSPTPKDKVFFSSYFMRKLDFSFFREYEGNWTRDPPSK